MQVRNFGGTFDHLFLWICLWNFHRTCLSTSSIPWCKKVKNDQKLKSKGSCLKCSQSIAPMRQRVLLTWKPLYFVYGKVVYKSLGLCATFQLSGVASVLVRLLFQGGLYAKSWVCKTRKSGLANVKWKWNLTLRLFQIYFKCEQTFGMRKAVGFSPTSRTLGRFFRAAAFMRVWLMCNLSSEKLRLLIKCGFYTRLTVHKFPPKISTINTKNYWK